MSEQITKLITDFVQNGGTLGLYMLIVYTVGIILNTLIRGCCLAIIVIYLVKSFVRLVATINEADNTD